METQSVHEEDRHVHGLAVLRDVLCLRTAIVNVVFVGEPGSDDYVLVDAGVRGYAGKIIEAAEERYGQRPPKAILLTHGHFDHVGALHELLEKWQVPVYAHALEMPYLTGKMAYPEPDPTVGGGLVAMMSPMFPNDPIDLGERVRALPTDGSIPVLPGWQSIHTPGHTQGHISLFRESDRTMISGDAFITTKQESVWHVLTQEQEIHGPPMYFTPDWEAAWNSVKKLERLKPRVVVTGHGLPMQGEELAQGLSKLAREFDTMAIPEHGRYVKG
ncbi:MBL fold metallo-hydrolase [Tumebacillus sp. DT12]|uniref:MBL fold metallo-hydrolase n=1 Tax=Tumebacillus lacus TaxID=2995335 RepID=A0ABT3WX87_9BACL|nr:MBL fold metallo-hydrolase [Tumebacillus lacus]MCX7569294.1 MBL fold metallo-hydrolase [Tumebacillus lacus]